MESWVIILLVMLPVAGVALWLIFVFGRAAIVGAVFFLDLASDQGFIGLAAYLAVWVFMFPVMLVICIIVGFGKRQEQKELEREDESRRLGHDD